VDWISLLPEQVRPQTPVAWAERLERGTTVRQVLDTMLQRMQKAATPAWLTWTIDDGRIEVAGTRARQVGTRTVVYPIGDLGRINIVIYTADKSGNGDSCSSHTEGARVVDDSDFVSLLDVFVAEIDPPEWVDNGGDVGRIRRLGTSFLITATASMHLQIEQLLSALRSSDHVATVPGAGVVVYNVQDLVGAHESGARNSSDDRETRRSVRDRIQVLGDELIRAVSPDGWVDIGGETSSWHSLGSKLIVRAPPDVQAGVARFLDGLRTGHADVPQAPPTNSRGE
jgi:hypothetical protein